MFPKTAINGRASPRKRAAMAEYAEPCGGFGHCPTDKPPGRRMAGEGVLMLSRWNWLFARLTRQLWFRATLVGLIGVAAAVVAVVADRFLPDSWTFEMGADAVDGILTILASSMLAVTTFSLTTLTGALGEATSNASPRATRLLMQDRVTQNVLSSFVGAFLFSIVGLVVLQTQAYGATGRAVLFIATIGVITLVVVSLLRWIDHLIRLGRVDETAGRVEQVARRALTDRRAAPGMGGKIRRPGQPLPTTARPVMAREIGYVLHVDMQKIEKAAASADRHVDLAILPGSFVHPGAPLGWVDGGADEALAECIHAACAVASSRDFDQDPRFGLLVMAEIGSRALSPGINDPGTAIDMIARITALLALWSEDAPQDEVRYPHVHVAQIETADLFEDAFSAIARDGAGVIEVQVRLQKALAALMGMGDAAFRNAARVQAALAFEHARHGLALESEVERLRKLMPGTSAEDAVRS